MKGSKTSGCLFFESKCLFLQKTQFQPRYTIALQITQKHTDENIHQSTPALIKILTLVTVSTTFIEIKDRHKPKNFGME